jgi:chitinase
LFLYTDKTDKIQMKTRSAIFQRKMQLFLLAAGCALLTFATRADLWTTGYYPGYRQSAMPPSAIDYTALTHIIHFSAMPTVNGTLDTAPNSMTFTRSTNLVQVAHAANRKVLFSVGPTGGSIFTNAASVANLPTFINNLTNFMVVRGYDGIDIDWEPISSSDSARFTAFINALRTDRSVRRTRRDSQHSSTHFAPRWIRLRRGRCCRLPFSRNHH